MRTKTPDSRCLGTFVVLVCAAGTVLFALVVVVLEMTNIAGGATSSLAVAGILATVIGASVGAYLLECPDATPVTSV
jgi:hypothetical protein